MQVLSGLKLKMVRSPSINTMQKRPSLRLTQKLSLSLVAAAMVAVRVLLLFGVLLFFVAEVRSVFMVHFRYGFFAELYKIKHLAICMQVSSDLKKEEDADVVVHLGQAIHS